MTIAEIIALETARQESGQFNVIHFVKDGDFFRAHDWSAWLMTICPFGEAMNKPLRVIAKKMKDGYIDAWCGFPASSIGKYVPNDGSVDFNPVSDTQVDVTIKLPEELSELSFDSLQGLKEEWKNSLPLNENKKQRREDREITEQAPRFVRVSDVVGRIISLPIEDISPREAWEILRDLRKQLSAMF